MKTSCVFAGCNYPEGDCSGACENLRAGPEVKKLASDDINHPAHYTAGKVECIDAIEAALTPEEYRGYLKGNILKYTWRERQKEGDKAMGKARWYLERLLGGGNG